MSPECRDRNRAVGWTDARAYALPMISSQLPPGQRWVDRPIVYDVAPAGPVDLASFRLRLHGAVRRPLEFSWTDLQALPRTRVARDFHCVTAWSVRAIPWEGVLTAELVGRVEPDSDANWVLARGRDGYSTLVPLDAFAASDSLVAYRMADAPLLPEHGYPLRLVVPSLYAWKSAKYLDELEFLRAPVRGFWEARGYHDRGDPWKEERYRGGIS